MPPECLSQVAVATRHWGAGLAGSLNWTCAGRKSRKTTGAIPGCTSSFAAVMRGTKRMNSLQICRLTPNYVFGWRKIKVRRGGFVERCCIALTSDPSFSFHSQRDGSKDRRKHTSVQNGVRDPLNHLPDPADGRHLPRNQTWVSAAVGRLDRTCLPRCSRCPFFNSTPFSSCF